MNKQQEEPPENIKPITGTIASIAQENPVHQATQMFTPIKVPKNTKMVNWEMRCLMI